MLDEMMIHAYETLSEAISEVAEADVAPGIMELHVWKLLMIYDSILCHTNSPLLELGEPECAVKYSWNYSLMLHSLMDTEREICMRAYGFCCVRYEVKNEVDAIKVSEDGEPSSLIDAIGNGDVFGKDSKYMQKYVVFAECITDVAEIERLSVCLYKHEWLGDIIIRAQTYGLLHSENYEMLMNALDFAFDGNEIIVGQSDYGVCDGVFYTYVSFWESPYCDADISTWRNMNPQMMRYVAEAMLYAGNLERELQERR